ncbi:hypothetical protein M422DRAFT_176821, partial [Sphaerobolus stellatus SS14]
CMNGTRQHIFDIVDNWCYDKKSKSNLLWISGSPGAGKSAIASSLVSRIGHGNCARFFFKRDSAYYRDPSNVWKTIAYRLAIINKDIGVYLDKFLETNPSYLDNNQRSKDFDTLIVKAFNSISQETQSQAPIVIIDALDECAISEEQKDFLASLANWGKLSNFKMIVTSRSQKDIQDAIGDCSYHLHIPTGQAVDATSTQDIHIFLNESFQQLDVDLGNFPHAINQLAQYSAGLFIWAKLAVAYIAAGTVTERLETVLMNMGQLGQFKDNNLNLDRLYAQILYSIFEDCTQGEKTQYEMVLGSLIFAKAPLSINMLEVIFDNQESKITSEAISIALGKFSPLLLSLNLDDRDAPLYLCHLSLQDFFQEDAQEIIYSKTQAGTNIFGMKRYQMALENSLGHICLGLLRYMNKELHFNMGGLETSYYANKDAIGLSQRLDKLISKSLRFSCQWWHEHLPENVDISCNGDLLKEADKFLKNKLLYWLEVMSLIEQIPAAAGAMQHAEHIFKARFNIILNNSVSGDICQDASHFIFTFKKAIGTSTPHIYLSALPMAPPMSLLKQKYMKDFQRVLGSIDKRRKGWKRELQVLKQSSVVQTLGFSPDGRHIVSGSDDQTIQIWDAKTGEAVGEPLQGHKGRVLAVAFSPDGKYIVSGSGDQTIQIWDAKTSEAVGEPLQEHINEVNAVAFSPDGKHIVSGSGDRTIRIWDARTGGAVGEPLQEHTDEINTVAFSPDGKHIISGSDDETIRIWDAKTGEAVGEPLQGHKGRVMAVAFSPDGKHIVSGFDDQTLQIWDAKTGEAMGKPLQGHKGTVWAVAFSPDGKHIVSGSGDQTIQIWDAKTGEVMCEPLQGHEGMVWAVAFSPDGKHIVSSSSDQTIQIWDAKTGEAVGEPLQGHEGRVLAVAFSPDGKHIVSGSSDQTIQIWDAKTGKAVGEPLQGHKGRVMAVAFSPDGKHIVSGSYDQTIQIWDAKTGEGMGEPLQGHKGAVWAVAFSPDGKHIVSGSGDQTIRIWDAKTSEAVGEPLQGHKGKVRAVAFSPYGKHIVSSSDDDTIQSLDGMIGAAGDSHKEDQVVEFSPSQNHISVISQDYPMLSDMRSLCVFSSHIYSILFCPDTCSLLFLTDDQLISTPLSHDAHQMPCFTHQCFINADGWLCLPKSPNSKSQPDKLLFWVLPESHNGLWWPGNTAVISQYSLKLDLSRFHHGEDWIACYVKNDCSKCHGK